MTKFDDLDIEIQRDLLEWYNLVNVSREEKEMLAKLYNDGRFASWDCPECKCRVYVGDPEDWDDFQGVLQRDMISYPGYQEKYTYDYLMKMCDDCRRTG